MHRLSLFGPFSLTDSSGADVPIASKKAKALLAYLAQTPGKPRSREEILALLWSDREEAQGRASLRQVLTGLRREVGEDLLQIDRDGVALTADRVEVAPLNGEDFLSRFSLPDPAFEDWLRDERLRLGNVPEPHEPVNATEITAKPSIVVLPFANLSGDPDDTYFSEGITEDIATELSRFGLTNVVARKSVFAYWEKRDDAEQALPEIETDYVVEGSVRRAGQRFRLSAKLIDRRTGQQIWADRFDREIEDIFAIQDELLQAIVMRVVGRLELHGSERALRKTPSSLAAYDCYLQGLWYARQYDIESYRSGCDVLRKAIALDPLFARAYGLLAVTEMTLSWSEETSLETKKEILAVALKAVELDPTDGNNYSDLGAVYLDLDDHEAARRNMETAMRLNPHDTYTWAQYAWLLNVLSQADRAIVYLDRALEIDPHPPNWIMHIRAECLFGLDRFEEATDLFEHLPLGYHEILGQLASCYGHLGESEKAQTSWAKLMTAMPGTRIADIGEGFGYINQADADRWTEGLRKAEIEDPEDANCA